MINHDDFDAEYDALPEDVQDELTAHRLLLEQFGPQLGRPHVDTLNGSAHANMKEIRFKAADGVWRFAFAFDPDRQPSFSAAATSRAFRRSASTRR